MRTLEFATCCAILKTLGALPRPLARGLAGLLARLLYWATPRFRRVAGQNLRMALPELTAAQRRAVCSGVYQSLGRLVAEFAHFPRLHPENLHQVVCYDGLENYQAALARGRGVLFLTAHLGAWELGAFAHALQGYPLNVLYRPLDNPRLNQLVNRYRVLSGNKLINKRESAREVLTALARNETVGILADQNSSAEEGVFVTFFGIPASTTAGIAKLAFHTGAAVVPAFCVWESSERRYHIVFEPPLEFHPAGNPDEDVRAVTRQMTGVIENYVRRYPDQWLWIHRRWKTRPPGEPPIYS